MEEWIFTFGYGQPCGGKCVRLEGTFEETRDKMMEYFGCSWGFQYSADEWEEMKNDPNRGWDMEEEILWEEAISWDLKHMKDIVEGW